MPIQVAESTKKPRGKKVLSHIEIHPKLGGGHMVRHVYHGFGHEPTEYEFNGQGITQGGTSIQSHLAKHAGLRNEGKEPYDLRKESETEKEITA